MIYFRLIRYKNLVMIALMQLIVLYGFLKLKYVPLFLADWQFFLLVFSTVCIAAGGYIINNIQDQDTDHINKPQDVIVGKYISENKAYNLYIIFTIIGVGIGFYLSNFIGRPNFVAIFIICAASLYIYATSLKQIMVIGNIVVALLLSISLLLIGLFMLFPGLDEYNLNEIKLTFSILIDFAIIAFILNFIREIVKDLEDYNGDIQYDIKTIAVVIGVNNTVKVVLGLSLVPIVCILYYIYYNLFELIYATIYLLFFVIAPLLYFTIKIGTAQHQKDFHHLSNVLKLVIFLGILSIGVIGVNMKFYVA